MRFLLAAVLAMIASDAAALSCVRPDIAASYVRADEAEETVYLLRGTLIFDEDQLPATDMLDQEQEPRAIAARFEGHALSPRGFTTAYARDVTLQPLCFGPWCGGAASGADAIIFATVLGDELVIEANPCGGAIFYNVTRQMVDQAIACVTGNCLP